MKKILGFALLLILVSCAPEANIDKCLTVEPYGFLSGLGHGILAVFAFIANLFGGEYDIYAANNTGVFYDLGFLLGIGALTSSGATVSKN